MYDDDVLVTKNVQKRLKLDQLTSYVNSTLQYGTKYFLLIFILSRLLVCVLIQIITTILHYLPLCVSIGIKHSEKQSIGRQLNNTNKKNNFKYIKLPSEQIEFTPTMLPLNRGSHAKIFKALR